VANLEKASMELGKAAYEAAKSQEAKADHEVGESGEPSPGGASDDDVIDAEYEVKDNK